MKMFCHSVVVVVRPYEFTENYLIVHFKLMNVVVYEFYVNLKKVRIYLEFTNLGHTTFLSCLKKCSSLLTGGPAFIPPLPSFGRQPACSLRNENDFKLSSYFKLYNDFPLH